MKININTDIIYEGTSLAVKRAVSNLKRDLRMACKEISNPGAVIYLQRKEMKAEEFLLKAEDGRFMLQAGDELGFIYGIYEISRSILGIQNFWFWNDQQIEKQDTYTVEEDFRYSSTPWKVRYRGWFVNDEVLIHTWSINRSKEKPWEMVFEALLRCGGNMVIPGTDRNARKYRKLAAEMGLYITHHHAEPLGAEMFSRAYPELNPSYDENKEKFQELWKKGIEEQKDKKVIWNIGFRGQGDCPFWENDPKYNTPELRGELMSYLIRQQYEMVKAEDKDAICCTNLYGETMELYQEGYLNLPEDVIKIWADNGFGKMVTRRQGNHNPRICALPAEGGGGKHGIYYHVSFYDLQAANHMTMLPNAPEFVLNELEKVINHGIQDYWIINCSNVKPHVYYLDFISNIWKTGVIDIETHRREYANMYYGKKNGCYVSEKIREYFKCALSYGKNEDEHAGEQFTNHVARILVSQFIKDEKERAEELLWAVTVKTLKEQVLWYTKLCKKGYERYSEYLKKCYQTEWSLTDNIREFYEDSIVLQAKIHSYCCLGAFRTGEALLEAMDRNWKNAFYKAGKAQRAYLYANQAMRDREHGKWHNFYENECLTDIKQTAWVLDGLMSYLRNLGDSPHFYQWQRELLYSEEDRRVMLIMNMENHLTNQEIFALMEEEWG